MPEETPGQKLRKEMEEMHARTNFKVRNSKNTENDNTFFEVMAAIIAGAKLEDFFVDNFYLRQEFLKFKKRYFRQKNLEKKRESLKKDLESEKRKIEGKIEMDEADRYEALGITPLEQKRMRATLCAFTKAEAEQILKVEQALSKQRENIVREGDYIAKKEIVEQIRYSMGMLSRVIKDLVVYWSQKYNFDTISVREMAIDIDEAIARGLAAIRKGQTEPDEKDIIARKIESAKAVTQPGELTNSMEIVGEEEKEDGSTELDS